MKNILQELEIDATIDLPSNFEDEIKKSKELTKQWAKIKEEVHNQRETHQILLAGMQQIKKEYYKSSLSKDFSKNLRKKIMDSGSLAPKPLPLPKKNRFLKKWQVLTPIAAMFMVMVGLLVLRQSNLPKSDIKVAQLSNEQEQGSGLITSELRETKASPSAEKRADSKEKEKDVGSGISKSRKPTSKEETEQKSTLMAKKPQRDSSTDKVLNAASDDGTKQFDEKALPPSVASSMPPTVSAEAPRKKSGEAGASASEKEEIEKMFAELEKNPNNIALRLKLQKILIEKKDFKGLKRLKKIVSK